MYEDTRRFTRPKHRPSEALHLTVGEIETFDHAALTAFTKQDLLVIGRKLDVLLYAAQTKAQMADTILDHFQSAIDGIDMVAMNRLVDALAGRR